MKRQICAACGWHSRDYPDDMAFATTGWGLSCPRCADDQDSPVGKVYGKVSIWNVRTPEHNLPGDAPPAELKWQITRAKKVKVLVFRVDGEILLPAGSEASIKYGYNTMFATLITTHRKRPYLASYKFPNDAWNNGIWAGHELMRYVMAMEIDKYNLRAA